MAEVIAGDGDVIIDAARGGQGTLRLRIAAQDVATIDHLGAGTGILQTAATPTITRTGSIAHTNGEARYLQMKGRKIFVSQTGGHFYTYDTTGGGNPKLIGTLTDDPHLDKANGFCISGDYAYVAVEDQSGSGAPHGVCVLDISTAPATFVSLLTLGGNGNVLIDAVCDGDYVYVASYNNHAVYVVDKSNPRSLKLAATITDTNLGAPQRLRVRGKHLWVAGDSRLTSINITDPPNAAIAGTAAINAYAIAVGSRYLLAADHGSDTVKVIDVKDPTSFGNNVVGTITDTTNLHLMLDICQSGDYAYTVQQTSTNNFTALDLTDVTNPKVLTSLTHAEAQHTFSCITDGQQVYTTNYTLDVVDLGRLSGSRTFDSAAVKGDLSADNLRVANQLFADVVVSPTVAPRDRNGVVLALSGIRLLVKAGPISDADFVSPSDGLCGGIDTLNGRLYWRYGAAWHYITFTA